MNKPSLIGQLKAEASRLGYSAYKVAQVSGLNESTIGRVFNEKFSPKLETVEAIAKALNVSLSIVKPG